MIVTIPVPLIAPAGINQALAGILPGGVPAIQPTQTGITSLVYDDSAMTITAVNASISATRYVSVSGTSAQTVIGSTDPVSAHSSNIRPKYRTG